MGNIVYSFLNVAASLTGPGAIALNLGFGAAVAEEGITIEAAEDKNVMTIGADGAGQHSLIANDACKVTLRYLKTSPVNAALQALYDAQSVSSALWGQNVITVTDSGRGDINVIQACAFKKKPSLTYAKEAGLIEWEFDGITLNTVLGGL
jgi:Protein of unknown function (DUF3277)